MWPDTFTNFLDPAPIYQPEVAANSIVDAAESLPRQKVLGTGNWLIVQLAQVIPGVGRS